MRAPIAVLGTVAAALVLYMIVRSHAYVGLPGVLYLVAGFLAGLIISRRLAAPLPPLVRLSAALLLGLLVSTWLTFLLALALGTAFADVLVPAAVLTIACTSLAVWAARPRLTREEFRLSHTELAVLGLAFLFSAWLYGHTLAYNSGRQAMTVSEGAWSDFSLHLALSRSFAWGDNLPPQYPMYAGPRIQYHFGYDFLAGVLERLGFRLDYAFNVPAVIGFTTLLVLLFEMGRLISGRRLGGVFAAWLMPLSSSWAFVYYFKRWHHDPIGLLRNLWEVYGRLHIGPYNHEIISSHFTMVPYVNQRQLTLAMAFGALVLVLLIRALHRHAPLPAREVVAPGLLLGLSFPLNGVVYLAVLSVTAGLFLCFRRWRDGALFHLAAVGMAAPIALLVGGGNRPEPHLGYLVEPLTVATFVNYWWLNFGLLLPLVIGLAILDPDTDLRILAAFWAPFVLGNVVQLGPDLSGINHKVFNFWAALMAVSGGVALARLATLHPPRVRRAGVAVVCLLLPLLTLSGVIDQMLVKNERLDRVFGDDGPVIAWVANHTPGDAVFLTAPYFYMPPSGAGRLLYLGFPDFPASAGYDVEVRKARARQIYGAPTLDGACALLLRERIDYVQIGPVEDHPGSPLGVNAALWSQLRPVYEADTRAGPLRYYRVADHCGKPSTEGFSSRSPGDIR